MKPGSFTGRCIGFWLRGVSPRWIGRKDIVRTLWSVAFMFVAARPFAWLTATS